VKTVRIGCGAGFSGDRIEPAVELAKRGDLQYLVFECLAERTIALAQQAKARDPRGGYDPLLVRRMEAVLPACISRGVRVITNMGAANPTAAAKTVKRIARKLGHRQVYIGTVLGDDVLDLVKDGEADFIIAETGEPVASLRDRLVSANAYIGAQPIVTALARGADIVITGRSADPSLFVAPLAYEFNWAFDDWPALGRGTLVGHLLECAGQITGGYFADPGRKDVDDLDRLGFPIADVPREGPIVITKVPGSGGRVTPATCKEQLLYEIHDPAAYVTPDTIADFSSVRVDEIERDHVAVDGATGRPRPDLLKVSLGYRDGYIGEGQIAYAGTGAVARARLAAEIVVQRLLHAGFAADALRTDLIGVNALHGDRVSDGSDGSRDQSREARRCDPYEVRLRIAGRATTLEEAQHIGEEVEALYTNGPAGGGGASAFTREVLSVASTYVPRALVHCTTEIEVV
jgi:hypothetical protein